MITRINKRRCRRPRARCQADPGLWIVAASRSGAVTADDDAGRIHDLERPVIDDRHIHAFGQRLVPEAFSRPHTAYLVERVEDVPRGPDAFERWRDELLVAAIAD